MCNHSRPGEAQFAVNPTRDTSQAEFLVFCDELTGLYNRRFFNRTFAELAQKSQADRSPLAAILIDVDFFKSINDRYGHEQGDAILSGVGACINETVGMMGYPIRYAGDEFSVLLPGYDRDSALTLAQALCEAIRSRPFTIASTGQPAKITFSVGVAQFPDDVEDAEKVFHCADHAAYMAKKGGRDQAVRYTVGAEHVLDVSTISNYFPCQKLIARGSLLTPLVDGLLAPSQAARPWTVIAGAAGVGKTRLLQDLRAKADTQRRVLFEATGLPFRASQPYSLILDALGAWLYAHPTAGQQVAAALDPAEIAAVSRLLPALSRYVLLAPSEQAQSQVDAAEALCKTMLSLSKGRSPSIIFDDFHLADQGTLRVLEVLRDKDPSTFVCIALRNDDDALGRNVLVVDFLEGLSARQAAVVVALDPLTPHQVKEMVTAILPDAAKHPALLELVADKAAGLPLLVEEILKFLVIRQSLRHENGQLVVDEIGPDLIPTDAGDILALRAGQVEEDIRALVSRAAVIGPEFDLATLLALEGTDEGYVRGILERARRVHLVTETSAGESFAFVSLQSHAAFYKSLPEEERKSLHLRIAKLREGQYAAQLDLALNELAFHFGRAGDAARSRQYRRVITALFSQFEAAAESEELKDLVTDDELDTDTLALAAAAGTAFKACRHAMKMYGFDFALRNGRFDQAVKAFDALFKVLDSVTFTEADGKTLINGTLLPPQLQYGGSLIDFGEHDVKGITFKAGLPPTELRFLLEVLTMGREELRGRGGVSRMLASSGVGHVALNETIYVAVGDRDVLLKRQNQEVLIKEVAADSRRSVDEAPNEERARWHKELAKYVDLKLLEAMARDWSVLREDLESGDAIRIAAASKTYLDARERAREPLTQVVAQTSDSRARAVALSLLKRIAPDAQDRLRHLLAESQEGEEKAHLIAALGLFKDPALAVHFEPYVTDDERVVRREAIRALAATSEASLSHMLLRALEDPREEVRMDAATAIGECRVHLAIPALLEIIKRSTMFGPEAPEKLQAKACQALAHLEDRNAVQALINALGRAPMGNRTKSPIVRAAAAMALEKLIADDTREMILKAMETAASDDETTVRSAAKVVLSRMSYSAPRG